jgi:hypothetical protein
VIDTNVVLDLLHFDDATARPLRIALEGGRVRCVVPTTLGSGGACWRIQVCFGCGSRQRWSRYGLAATGQLQGTPACPKARSTTG